MTVPGLAVSVPGGLEESSIRRYREQCTPWQYEATRYFSHIVCANYIWMALQIHPYVCFTTESLPGLFIFEIFIPESLEREQPRARRESTLLWTPHKRRHGLGRPTEAADPKDITNFVLLIYEVALLINRHGWLEGGVLIFLIGDGWARPGRGECVR